MLCTLRCSVRVSPIVTSPNRCTLILHASVPLHKSLHIRRKICTASRHTLGEKKRMKWYYPYITWRKIKVIIFHAMCVCSQLQGPSGTIKDFGMINATREAALLGVATFQMQLFTHRDCPQNVQLPVPRREPRCYCKTNVFGSKLSGFFFTSFLL